MAPASADTYLLAGLIYRRMGQVDKSLEALHRAVELAPETPYPEAQLAYTLQLSGAYEEASLDYERVLALGYDVAWVHTELGSVYHRLERLQDAIAEYERGVRIDSKKPWSRLLLARAYREAGLLAEAIAEYEQVLSLDSQTYAYVHRELEAVRQALSQGK